MASLLDNIILPNKNIRMFEGANCEYPIDMNKKPAWMSEARFVWYIKNLIEESDRFEEAGEIFLMGEVEDEIKVFF